MKQVDASPLCKGDRVTYHGSLLGYAEYGQFTVIEAFVFHDVECVSLQGPRTDIYIARCRAASCTRLETS